jgi:dipeptidyl aminopeptidase/acylaminoacyl peptidase
LDGTDISPGAFNVAARLKGGIPTLKTGIPPTYIIHGSIDDCVPPSQSIDVVEAMKERGVDVTFEYLEGKGHVYDRAEGVEMDEMYAWIKKILED